MVKYNDMGGGGDEQNDREMQIAENSHVRWQKMLKHAANVAHCHITSRWIYTVEARTVIKSLF